MKKLLFWGDSPVAATGFGNVARHILEQLPGIYDIDVLGVNHLALDYDKKEFPYRIFSAEFHSRGADSFGYTLLPQLLSNKYDALLIVLNKECISKVRAVLKDTTLPIVAYIPHDMEYIVKSLELYGFMDRVDRVVFFTNDVRKLHEDAFPEYINKFSTIYHGVDTDIFKPLKNTDKLKKKYLNIDADKFVVLNVNRNTPRKNLTQTFRVFRMFKEKHPEAELYIHTQVIDDKNNLYSKGFGAGLSPNEYFTTDKNFKTATGITESEMNKIYNLSDVFLNTTLGEGWGLSNVEAMACGKYVVAPNNTSLKEILADGRGLLAENSGEWVEDQNTYRPLPSTLSLLDNLEKVYNKWKQGDKVNEKALAWARQNTWDQIGKQWRQLLERL